MRKTLLLLCLLASTMRADIDPLVNEISDLYQAVTKLAKVRFACSSPDDTETAICKGPEFGTLYYPSFTKSCEIAKKIWGLEGECK